MASRDRKTAPAPLELCEQSFELLRTSGPAVILLYYLGSIPFVLGALFFASSMIRSPTADEHCAAGAFGVALLFLWMKLCQSVFAGRLRAVLTESSPEKYGTGTLVSVFVSQTCIHATGLFLLPISALIAFPLAWVLAFYQSATAAPVSEQTSLKRLTTYAAREAALWPMQNHVILTAFSALSLFVFVNVCTGILALPWLMKTLFGIDSAFSLNTATFLNTTFVMVVLCITYLLVDPLFKAVHVMRSFYGSSKTSGIDLQMKLRAIQIKPSIQPLVLLFLILPSILAAPLKAAEVSPETRMETSRAAQQLDHSIERTLEKPEYQWKMSREKTEKNKNMVTRFLDDGFAMIKKALLWARDVIVNIIDWFNKPSARGSNSGWGNFGVSSALLRWLMLFLGIILAGAIALALFRRHKKSRKNAVPASPVDAEKIDLMSGDVSPDQMPENDWMRMADEALARADFRRALRAMLLATLSHLADKKIIDLARFKSNHDYEREVIRRCRATPLVPDGFSEIVTVYDRVWYGAHEVNSALVEKYQARVSTLLKL